MRVPPMMPPYTRKSGHCIIGFDVGANGQTLNVKVKSCSDKIFKQASLKAVKDWYYTPKVEGGIAVEQTGLEEKIRFVLDNGKGKVLR